MSIHSSLLPDKIYLNDYAGNYERFIDAVYEVFEKDFINHHPSFGGVKLGLKYKPEFQKRAYTFYHMTHKGEIETERIPDIRRCECMPWGRPAVEKVEEYSFKFWPQKRKNKYRVCIWVETEDDVDYFFILDVRKDYILPWTAFVAEYSDQVCKKQKEYNEWLASENGALCTPFELIRKIRDEMS